MRLLISRRVTMVVLLLLSVLTSATAVLSNAAPILLWPQFMKPTVPSIRDDSFGGGGTLLLPTIRNVNETKHVNYVLMDASGKNETPLWPDYDSIPNNFFASFVGDKGDIIFSGSTANYDTVGPYKNLKLELYLTNLAGSKLEKLPDADDAQSWIVSPDGKYLALMILYTDNAGLNVYDMETHTRTRIVPTDPTDPTGQTMPLFFSADSKKLVFRDHLNGINNVYDLAEKTVTPVSPDEVFGTLSTKDSGFPFQVAVSISKSGKIASCEVTDYNKFAIFLRDDWSSKPTELLKMTPQKPPCFTVRWSPDEKYLLYGGWGSGSTTYDNKYLALSIADGKTTLLREMLFTGQSDFQNADWSPLSR